MSKITFRADDELVGRLEEFDASKSEVMREALREYLEGARKDEPTTSTATADGAGGDSLDALVAERVDAIIDDRLGGMFTPRQPQDVNVNVSLSGDSIAEGATEGQARKTGEEADGGSDTEAEECKTCQQCGENLDAQHVYCPNCGEKASRRVFCECGDELRSDWAFCPGCGRRTTAADVLDQP